MTEFRGGRACDQRRRGMGRRAEAGRWHSPRRYSWRAARTPAPRQAAGTEAADDVETKQSSLLECHDAAGAPTPCEGPGGIRHNGTRTQPPNIRAADRAAAGVPQNFFTAPTFLFEPETPYASLKSVPIWNEIEQMLDNPYAMAVDPVTPGNFDGYPSYRSTIVRRPSFAAAGATLLNPGPRLPDLLVHPLNYNPANGEEMRLLNPGLPGRGIRHSRRAVSGPGQGSDGEHLELVVQDRGGHSGRRPRRGDRNRLQRARRARSVHLRDHAGAGSARRDHAVRKRPRRAQLRRVRRLQVRAAIRRRRCPA